MSLTPWYHTSGGRPLHFIFDRPFWYATEVVCWVFFKIKIQMFQFLKTMCILYTNAADQPYLCSEKTILLVGIHLLVSPSSSAITLSLSLPCFSPPSKSNLSYLCNCKMYISLSTKSEIYMDIDLHLHT